MENSLSLFVAKEFNDIMGHQQIISFDVRPAIASQPYYCANDPGIFRNSRYAFEQFEKRDCPE